MYYPESWIFISTQTQADGAAVSAQQEDNSHTADAANAADPPPTNRSKEHSSALMSLLGPAYKLKQSAALERSAAKEGKDEVKGYREADPLLLSENPLSWWIKHQESYHLLTHQAKQCLCVPETSVLSERVFSMVSDLTTVKRSCLTPEHVVQPPLLTEILWYPASGD